MNPIQFNKLFGYLGKSEFCYVIPKKGRFVVKNEKKDILVKAIEVLDGNCFLRVNINMRDDFSFVLQNVALKRTKSNSLLVTPNVLERVLDDLGYNIDSLVFRKIVIYCPVDKLRKQKIRKDIAVRNREINQKIKEITFATKNTPKSLVNWASKNKKELEKKSTMYEKMLYKALYKTFKERVKVQHPYLINGHLYYADISIPSLKLIIEVDGGYHNNSEQKVKDNKRDDDFKSVGYKTLRYTNEQVSSRDGKKKIIQDVMTIKMTRKQQTLN